jgi:hypothetical protein
VNLVVGKCRKCVSVGDGSTAGTRRVAISYDKQRSSSDAQIRSRRGIRQLNLRGRRQAVQGRAPAVRHRGAVPVPDQFAQPYIKVVKATAELAEVGAGSGQRSRTLQLLQAWPLSKVRPSAHLQRMACVAPRHDPRILRARPAFSRVPDASAVVRELHYKGASQRRIRRGQQGPLLVRAQTGGQLLAQATGQAGLHGGRSGGTHPTATTRRRTTVTEAT